MTKLYRDAATGKWATAADAAARPAETVAETVPARYETPDVAELRRLAEAATPGPWEADGLEGTLDSLSTGRRVAEVTMWPEVDAAFIAAANPTAVLALLDDADALRAELAHMTEARDNARAEVERMAGLLAEADEPHPDRPNCTTVGGKGVRVTATDLEIGESASVVIDDDYVLICAGDHYQSEVQRHANGTTVLTVKVRKHLTPLDGGSGS